MSQLSLETDWFTDWMLEGADETPSLKPTARWYQDEAHERIIACLQDNRSCLTLMATGTGKTQVFSALARDWAEGDVLVTAHRDELVEQAKQRLELVTGEDVEIEQGPWKSGRARIVVASLQTISRKSRLERLGKDRFGLIIADECFPADTLVDNRPISTIRVGDMVSTVNHATGCATRRRVVRVFYRTVESLIELKFGERRLRCTPNHPIFISRQGAQGYVQAKDVARGDLLCVWEGFRHVRGYELPTAQNVLSPVSILDLVSDDGEDEPALRFRPHAEAQPDARPGVSQAHVPHPAQDATSSTSPRWEREGLDRASGHSGRGARMAHRGRSPNPNALGEWVSFALQARRRLAGLQDRRGGGWPITLLTRASSPGSEEGRVLAWARVDRVQSEESRRAGGTRVYNLEVEGTHTYFANDVLVHNCHHMVAKTYRKPIDYFSSAKIAGFTATPDRGDSIALGKIFDEVAYALDIADAIEDGWLVPIVGKTVQAKEIDLSRVTASKGDLQVGELDLAMLEAVEHICQETLRICPDRQGIVFWPGVRSAELAMFKMNELKPGSAAFVCGETETMERRRIMDDYRAGRVQFLHNVQIATEGFDAPATSVIVMARPTKSRALAAQMAGRGTRALPGIVDAYPMRGQEQARRDAIQRSAKRDCLLLDFVGNAGRHQGMLITPTDILGGSYSDAEVAQAKKLAEKEGGGDIAAQLKAARALLKRLAQEYTGRVKSEIVNWDPFALLGIKPDDNERYLAFGAEPLTQKQYDTLKKCGLDDDVLDGMTKRQAGDVFRRMDKRRVKGLCSMGKANVLRKYGIDPTNVTEENAKRALDYLAQVGWRRGMNPHELDRIAFGRRRPGED